MKEQIDRQAIMDMNPLDIVPHGDRYLVRIIDVESVVFITDGAGNRRKIEVPVGTETQEESAGYYLAEVIAAGSGHRLEADVVVPMPFAVGDIVMVERFSGRDVNVSRGRFRIINQVDVLAKFPSSLLRPVA